MTISQNLNPFLTCAAVAGVIWGPVAVSAEPGSGPAVTISVTEIETHEGFIMAALYDEAGWGGAPIEAVSEPVSGGAVTVTIAAPAPGQYAIRLFHDVDGNGELNSNMMGIPTEPFGFSNNAPPRFGPPSFAAAAFEVGDDGAVQTITLQ